MTDYSRIKIHALFDPIKKIFDFFILGTEFLAQPNFQRIFLQHYPEQLALLNGYNREVNLRIEGRSVKSETKLYWGNIGRLMAIAIFDILQCSEYHNVVKKTEIFKFAKHIRNGAAHENKFDLNPPIKKPISWRKHTIMQSLNKKTVFPDFINPADLIHLMADISEVIEKNGKKKNGHQST